MSKKQSAYPLVCVYWKDITAGGEWLNKEKLCKWGADGFEQVCTSVGYLIDKKKDYVVIAGTLAVFDGEEHFNDFSMIMTSVIVKTTTLTEK